MSLVRLALRQSIVAALTNAYEPPYPTIAGAFVFDSKVDPPEHTAAETLMPCIIVYTDADEHMQLDRATGRQFTSRQITCVLELVIGSFQREADSAPTFSAVQTDAEMEAMMDLFEWQVWRAINHPAATGNAAFGKLVKRIEEWKSEPARAAEQANRLALRQIVFQAHTANDCLPTLGMGPLVEAPAAQFFEAPYLAALQEAIENNPDLATLCDQLRRARTGTPDVLLPPLKDVRVAVDFIDPVVDPNRLPAGTSPIKGPDGRVEVVADFKLGED